MGYEYRAVRKATAERVEAAYMECGGLAPCGDERVAMKDPAKRLSVEIDLGRRGGCYQWREGKWVRVIVKPEPKPKYIVNLVFGHLRGEIKWPGGNPGAIIRFPGSGVSWAKVVLPGLMKLIHGLGNKLPVAGLLVDGDGDMDWRKGYWSTRKSLPRYDWVGGRFKLVK